MFDQHYCFLPPLVDSLQQSYMEALSGQNLPPGYINYVIGSLYGHPVSAYRAKEKLHATLTCGGLFMQSKFDNCLYCLVHPSEKFWVPVHVDDMGCAGTPGGFAIAVARLREDKDYYTRKS